MNYVSYEYSCAKSVPETGSVMILLHNMLCAREDILVRTRRLMRASVPLFELKFC